MTGHPGSDQMLEKLDRLPQWKQNLLILLVLILPMGVFWFFFYRPAQLKLSQFSQEYQVLAAQMHLLSSKANQLKRLKEEIETAGGRFQSACQAFPVTDEISTLVEKISQCGRKAGLELIKFEPKAMRNQGFLVKTLLSLSLRGPYGSLVSFFKALARLPRIVTIMDLRIAPWESSAFLTAECTAAAWRLAEKDGPPNGEKDRIKGPDKK